MRSNRPETAPPGVTWEDDLFTRHFGCARIRGPFGEVAVYSVHLDPHKQFIRKREIAAVLDTMRADGTLDAPAVVQGDLNHRPDTDEYGLWKDAGLTDAFAAKGNGSGATNPASRPFLRIDYIWLTPPLAARLIECRPLAEAPFLLDKGDRTAFVLSDHLPVLAAFAP